MRWVTTVAGAVLALGMGLWGLLRAQAPVVAAPVTLAALKSSLAVTPVVVHAGDKVWTQSEKDRAWCHLPVPEHPAWANDPATQQSDAEVLRLRGRWSAILRERGDERSLAAADVIEGSEAAKRHLFDLARNTSDPVVFGWAMSVCMERPGCELSAQRWVQLDPGNLMPWAMELRQALVRGDLQAQREAVYQIGLSRRGNDYRRLIFALEYSMAQANQPGLQMNSEVMQPFNDYVFGPPGPPLTRYCLRPEVLSDSAENGMCLTAADKMWRYAEDLAMIDEATAYGLSFAAPDDPLWDRRQDELMALRKRSRDHLDRLTTPARQASSSCTVLPAMRRYFANVSAIGELAALRQLPDTPPQ